MRYDPERHHRRSIRLRGYDYRAAGAYFITIVAQDRACLFGEVVDGEMRLSEAGRMVERWWLELNCRFPHVLTDAYVVMPNHFHGIVVIHSPPPDTTAPPDVGADLRVCPDSGGAHDGGAHAGAPLQSPDLGGAPDVGADLRVCPYPTDTPNPTDIPNPHPTDAYGGDAHDGGAHAGAPLQSPDLGGAPDVGADLRVCPDSGGTHDGGAHAGAPLPTIVQWFKTMTTNEYIRMVKHAGWTPFRGRLWQRNYYEHIIRNERALERIRDYILTNPLHWHLDRENTHAIGINSLEEEWFG
jgi:putative transposase